MFDQTLINIDYGEIWKTKLCLYLAFAICSLPDNEGLWNFMSNMSFMGKIGFKRLEILWCITFVMFYVYIFFYPFLQNSKKSQISIKILEVFSEAQISPPLTEFPIRLLESCKLWWSIVIFLYTQWDMKFSICLIRS